MFDGSRQQEACGRWSYFLLLHAVTLIIAWGNMGNRELATRVINKRGSQGREYCGVQWNNFPMYPNCLLINSLLVRQLCRRLHSAYKQNEQGRRHHMRWRDIAPPHLKELLIILYFWRSKSLRWRSLSITFKITVPPFKRNRTVPGFLEKPDLHIHTCGTLGRYTRNFIGLYYVSRAVHACLLLIQDDTRLTCGQTVVLKGRKYTP